MRTNGNTGVNNLHWHDGSTCHGAPSLEACAKDAIKHGDIGKILEQTDTFEGDKVKCYSMIVSKFDHWAKHGKYVAVIELTLRKL